jgi:hypothetical protein
MTSFIVIKEHILLNFVTFNYVLTLTITLTCDTGFGVNGSSTRTKTFECESDRKFTPLVSCMGNVM